MITNVPTNKIVIFICWLALGFSFGAGHMLHAFFVTMMFFVLLARVRPRPDSELQLIGSVLSGEALVSCYAQIYSNYSYNLENLVEPVIVAAIAIL
jgi:hypothetical protein